MSIVKISRKQNPFVMIEKSIFEDNTISWAAKGVMGYLLSKPDGWKVNVGDIVNHSPVKENGQKKRGNGEEAIYSVLKELRQNGYAEKECIREKGIIVGWNWTVFEVKQQNANTTKTPHPAKPHLVKPDEAKPDEANPDYNNNEVSNNESSNNTILTDSITELPKGEKAAPAESKPDFAKLTVEEQLRAVYLYAQKKLAGVDSEAITAEEKAEKRVKYGNTLTALLSSDFRAVIEQYKQYRKGNKRIGKAGKWYETEVTLCAVVAKLAELAGITNGAVNMANVRRVYEQTVENNYVGFYELKTPKESTTKQPTQNTQPAPRNVQGFNAIAEF